MRRALKRLIWIIFLDGETVSEDRKLYCGLYNSLVLTLIAAGIIWGLVEIVSSAG